VSVCRLFSVDAFVEADLRVSYTFKLPTSSDIRLAVGLAFSAPAAAASPLWLVGNDTESSDHYCSLTQCSLSRLRFARQHSVNAWTTRCRLPLPVVLFFFIAILCTYCPI